MKRKRQFNSREEFYEFMDRIDKRLSMNKRPAYLIVKDTIDKMGLRSRVYLRKFCNVPIWSKQCHAHPYYSATNVVKTKLRIEDMYQEDESVKINIIEI